MGTYGWKPSRILFLSFGLEHLGSLGFKQQCPVSTPVILISIDSDWVLSKAICLNFLIVITMYKPGGETLADTCEFSVPSATL